MFRKKFRYSLASISSCYIMLGYLMAWCLLLCVLLAIGWAAEVYNYYKHSNCWDSGTLKIICFVIQPLWPYSVREVTAPRALQDQGLGLQVPGMPSLAWGGVLEECPTSHPGLLASHLSCCSWAEGHTGSPWVATGAGDLAGLGIAHMVVPRDSRAGGLLGGAGGSAHCHHKRPWDRQLCGGRDRGSTLRVTQGSCETERCVCVVRCFCVRCVC